MNPCSTDAETNARLTRLEEKFGYAEDLLDALNALVTKQQDQIAQLLREVGQLQRQRADDPASTPASLWDELPPHY
jgi:SlyX protein